MNSAARKLPAVPVHIDSIYGAWREGFRTGMQRLSRIPPLLLCSLFSLSACVSYEPAQLVPAVSLSPEEVSLSNASDSSQVDFGLDVSSNESDSLFNLETLPGIRVRSVTANGPAASAGIKVGDIILNIDGIETNHPDVLPLLARQDRAEFSYRFTMQRDTLVLEATVIARPLDSNPPARELYRIDPVATRAGYRSELVSVGAGQVAAARVLEIFPRSPLPTAGIEPGDLLLALNGIYLNSAQDLVTRLNREFEPGDRVSITRIRGGELAEISLQLWEPDRRISRITLGPLFRYESSLNPNRSRLSIVDLWLFSLYSYEQIAGEHTHSLLGLFKFSSDVGELTEESSQ